MDDIIFFYVFSYMVQMDSGGVITRWNIEIETTKLIRSTVLQMTLRQSLFSLDHVHLLLQLLQTI